MLMSFLDKIHSCRRNQNEGNAISDSYRIPPLIPVYDIAGNYAGTHAFTINNTANPVAMQQRSQNNLGNDVQITGNAFAEMDFPKHFESGPAWVVPMIIIIFIISTILPMKMRKEVQRRIISPKELITIPPLSGQIP